MVIFTSLRDRALIWNAKGDIRKMGVIVLEDIPTESVAARRTLKPIQRIITKKRNGDGDKPIVRFKQDKTEVNGKLYSVDKINDLPSEYNPQKMYTPMNSMSVVFFTHFSPFSNHHPALFTLDTIHYNCSEQYIMSQKARLFNDKSALKMILEEETQKNRKP